MQVRRHISPKYYTRSTIFLESKEVCNVNHRIVVLSRRWCLLVMNNIRTQWLDAFFTSNCKYFQANKFFAWLAERGHKQCKAHLTEKCKTSFKPGTGTPMWNRRACSSSCLLRSVKFGCWVSLRVSRAELQYFKPLRSPLGLHAKK